MGTYHGAIYEVDFPLYLASGISVSLHLRPQLVPYALLTPTVEAGRHGFPGAIAIRHISPGSTGLAYPQDAIYDCAMVQ